MPKLEKCTWILDLGFDQEVWTTDCGNMFEFTVAGSGPEENKFEYCPYCGGKITEKRVEPEEPEIF